MKRSPLLVLLAQLLSPLMSVSDYKRALSLLGLSLIIAGFEIVLTLSFANLAQILNPTTDTQSPSVIVDLLHYISDLLWSQIGIQQGLLLSCLALLVAVLLIRAGLQLFYQWHLSRFSETLGLKSRLRIFRLYQHAPSLWLEHTGLAELNFNITASMSVTSMSSQSLSLLSNTLVLIFLLGALVFSSQHYSIIFVTLLCFTAIILVQSLKKKIKLNADTIIAHELSVAQLAHDTLQGLKPLRLAQKEAFSYDQFSHALHGLLQAKLTQGLLSRLPSLSLEFLGFLSLFICAFFYSSVITLPTTQIAHILALLAAIAWRALPVINQSLNAYTALRLNQTYLERILKLFEAEQRFQHQKQVSQHIRFSALPNIAANPFVDSTQTTDLSFIQALHIKGLSFSYPQAQSNALHRIDLTIKKGQKLALIGDSGAGKSTLAQLLVGLFQAEQGHIFIDHQELNLESLYSWLPQVGYVAQDSHIFNLSLKENIALRDLGQTIDMDRVQQVCHMACINFVSELEQGFETKLGEHGFTLSGGQIQRVALARALYHQPHLLILDESCNAIDLEMEKLIIRRLLQDQQLTLLVITHRLEICQEFTELAWLKEGSLCQFGPTQGILNDYQKYLTQKHKKQSL